MSQTLDHVNVAQFVPGNKLNGVYHLLSVDQRTKKNGDPYYMMTIGDASGNVNGIMWDNHAGLVSGVIQQDDFVSVEGDVGEYNGNTQVVLRKIERVDDSEVELKNFIPTSPRPLEEMEQELDGWIAKVTDPDCQKLLKKLFGHDRLREMYLHAPAAVRIHQAYVHGLVDHTLAVMRIAFSIAKGYEPINYDLLITGTLIHDIGKVRELSWKRTITYTTEGRLMGHIFMGASMIDSMINEIRRASSFNKDLQAELLHMILSHHGKMEYGSPVIPKSREALVLPYADYTDAYMASFQNEVAPAVTKGEPWTGYSKMFQSYLYVGRAADGATNDSSMEEMINTPEPMEDVNPAQ